MMLTKSQVPGQRQIIQNTDIPNMYIFKTSNYTRICISNGDGVLQTTAHPLLYAMGSHWALVRGATGCRTASHGQKKLTSRFAPGKCWLVKRIATIRPTRCTLNLATLLCSWDSNTTITISSKPLFSIWHYLTTFHSFLLSFFRTVKYVFFHGFSRLK